METKYLKILDFSDVLGSRYGDFSATEFFNIKLQPNLEEAIKNNYKLIVNLDGTYGISAPFLDQIAFLLLKCFKYEDINKYLEFDSKEHPYPQKINIFLEERIEI